jgi:recombination DNA repair RAD52 pathway protein
MKLTAQQYEQLLKPLNASRVAQRNQAGISLSYLEAWDVKAHLIRIFGFGNWSADVISAELVFEDKDEKSRWNVGYRVLMRLRIHSADDFLGDTTYTEAAVGSATLPQRGEAHDMAIKTAESDALKRAAINLGTQFGLSLYDSGNRNDVVRATLVPPVDYKDAEQQHEQAPAHSETKDDQYEQTLLASWAAEAEVAEDKQTLKEIWDNAVEQGVLDEPIIYDGAAATLRSVIVDRISVLDQESANE